MFSLFRTIGSAFGFVSKESELVIPEPNVPCEAIEHACSLENTTAINTLIKAYDEDDEDFYGRKKNEIEPSDLSVKNDAQYMYKTGKVTSLDVNSGVIDSVYYFKLKNAPPKIDLGQTVEYVLYRKKSNSGFFVQRVTRILEGMWSDSSEDEDENIEEKKADKEERKETCVNIRHKVCTISKREGRDIFIDPPGNYSFNLDNVKTSFVPMEGDWVTVVMVTESSGDSVDGCGEILEVQEIMPLRFKIIEGKVSDWNTERNMGIIGRETFFDLDSCEIGYVPVTGDTVDAHIIESQQGYLLWRALKVIPYPDGRSDGEKEDKAGESSTSDEPNEKLMIDKCGISISRRCFIGGMKLNEERDIILEVVNNCHKTHKLINFGFKSKFQNQFSLVTPDPKNKKPIQFSSMQKIKFVFRCKARFLGRSSDLFVWNFENFDIGRILQVEVEDSYIKEYKDTKSKFGRQQKKIMTLDKLIATRNGFIIAGVRPVRPAPFIPIKLGQFPVPDQYWKLVVGEGFGKVSSKVVEMRLTSAVPCLSEPLSPKNYEARWHALLYLEEVHEVLALRQYDMERAIFQKVGEYLVLEVPGLGDKRPGLICGDKVLAKDPVATDEDIAYEGFIHKIIRSELYIKFNEQFQAAYDGKDYNISFTSSRLGLRRCHQAVKVGFQHLTSNWLFPSSLNPSKPLITFEEEEEGDENLSENSNGEKENQLDNIEKMDTTREDISRVKFNGEISFDESPPANSVKNESLTLGDVFKNSHLNMSNENSSCISDKTCNKMSMNGQTHHLENNINNSNSDVSVNYKDDVDSSKTNNNFIATDSCKNFKKIPERNLNNMSCSENSRPDGISGTSPRVSVADWLKSNVEKTRGDSLLQLLGQEGWNSRSPNNNSLTDFNVSLTQMKTLEEIEKTLLKNEKGHNGIVMSAVSVEEVEKPLLTNKQEERKIVKCDSKKIIWDNLGHQQKNTAKQCVIREISSNSVKKKLNWFNKKLNWYQKEAVRNVLKCEARPLPYVIFGPPGTGKTITLVEAALQILFLKPESRLLVAAPSNSAADLICERLIDSGAFPVGTLIRLCSYTYFTERRFIEKLSPYCTSAEFRVYEGNQTIIDDRGFKRSTRESLGRHRVTIGTCVSLGVLYNMGFPQGHFTHVFVDEAGQATEPEILIPLSFLDNLTGQSILVGDPQQLGPVVFSPLASTLGLGDSLLSRLLNTFPYFRDQRSFSKTCGFDPRLVTRLVDNYRSLPEILHLPSSMFYDNHLIPHVKEDSEEAAVLLKLKELLPKRSTGLPPAIVFNGVRGFNYQDHDSPSWFNPHEIVQTVSYVNLLYDSGLTADDIGIITPYQKQVVKIRQVLNDTETPLPKIGSVEEFQGQERLVIILSTVRSSPGKSSCEAKYSLGFISSPQRLNVALTRARALIILIGNPHLLNHDPYWRTVLKYCVTNNAYCGCNLPEEFLEELK